MKDLKINEVLQKLAKKARLVLIVATIGLCLTGCNNETDEVKELRLEVEELNKENETLRKANKYNENKDNDNDNDNNDYDEDNYDIEADVSKDIKENNNEEITDNDANEYDNTSNSDGRGEPYYIEYYDAKNGGIDTGKKSGWVYEKTENGKTSLIDESNPEKILIEEYDSISNPYYMEYYDCENGGPRTGYGSGWVVEVTRNGKIDVVDYGNFNTLLSDCDEIKRPFYMNNYDSMNGGVDKGEGAGWVQEITKKGKKYLTDANDWKLILAKNYQDITEDHSNIIIKYKKGNKKILSPEEFKGKKSKVLTKK